ncbi:MauE/DoxX family redox-associated membrane protein [Thermostaphylospora chromogena]|uniref:Methylamine utilisation protein MauE n=1 Tax=Thermostaphylospora chromogena TaxID=35622 RepID=A0A1H1D3S4_9ACTN|nr:MauE/DoxX family redox-associated membrane protein [Thermostaphylospora chromogena]SDQ71094.1 Methylamine utilisation protein MauE [Thermostaphylospora chromogena]
MIAQYLALVCQVSIGAIFLCAAVGKLMNPRSLNDLATLVRTTGLIRGRLSAGFGALILTVELAIASAMAIPVRLVTMLGFAMAACFMLFSIFVIFLLNRRGTAFTCACFGSSVKPLGPIHVVRNLMIALIACVGMLFSPEAGRLPSTMIALAVVTGLTAGGFLIALDRLSDLFSSGGSRISLNDR